jgi:hypothetical protein
MLLCTIRRLCLTSWCLFKVVCKYVAIPNYLEVAFLSWKAWLYFLELIGYSFLRYSTHWIVLSKKTFPKPYQYIRIESPGLSWLEEVGVAQSVRSLTTDLATGVWSPAQAKDFSSGRCVQTGPGSHPASCPMGTGGPFPGDKARPGRDADTHPI